MFSIQIQLGSNGRVAAVYCGGRPKKLFGLEGDHTTAWHVITEGIENVLRGRTLPEALGVMRGMCEKLVQLPGYRFVRRLEESDLGERVVTTNTQLTELYATAGIVLKEMEQESLERKQRGTALPTDVQPRQSLRLALLQNFIRAYLEMRYLVPFSVAFLGLAHGKGEPARLQKLRDHHMTLAENSGNTFPPDTLADIRINMWGLLDVQTVAQMGMANLGYRQATRSTLAKLAELAQKPEIAKLDELPTLTKLVTLCKGGPVTKQADLNKLLTMARMATLLVIERGDGTDDTIPSNDLLFVDAECHTLEERLAAALSQHLITLSWAYPLLYERSGIAAPGAVTAFLAKHGCETSLAAQVLACMKPFDVLKNVTVAVHAIERNYGLAEIVLEDEDENGNVPVRPGAFAVQLNVDPNLVITEVRQGGRPEPTFGSSLGDHTTAWGVIEYGVRNAILLKRVPDAIQNMVALANNSLTLPGIRLADNLDPRHAERYRWAGAELTGLAKLFKAPNGELSLSLLENYVRGYLLFRHIIPLTAINNGIASGHGEPAHLQAVQAAEERSRFHKTIAPDEKSALRLAMWELLDMNALAILATDNKDNPHWNYKSSGPSVLERQPYSTLGANLLSYKQTLASGIQQHLMTLCASFPNVYPLCQIGTKQAVAAVLKRHGIVDAADILTMLQQAGIVVDDNSVVVSPAELTAPAPKGKKTSKKQDEASYEASYEDDGDDGDGMW